MVGEQDQLGRRETAVFDEAGRVIEAIRKDGTTIEVMPVETQSLLFGIDTTDPGNPAQLKSLPTAEAIYVDANGSISSFSLDRGGQTEAARDSEGGQGGVIRDGRNLILEQTNARGNRSNYSYDDRGNLLSSSDELSSNSTSLVGTLENEFDRAIFTFDLDDPQSVYFDSFGATDLDVTVVGSAGVVYDQRAGFEWARSVPFLQPGRYTVTLESSSESPQAYRFEVHTFADATPVQMGSTVTGSVGGDAIVYRLDGQPGDLFNLRRLLDFTNATIRVLDGSGAELNGRTSSDIENFTLPRAGDLYLVVEFPSGNVGSEERSDFSFVAELVNNEPIDAFAGDALTLGTAITGALEDADDEVFYTFNITGQTPVYFDARTNESQIRWDLEGPYGSVLTNQSFFSSPSTSQLDRLRLLAGNYQLRVYSVGSNPFGGEFPADFNFALLNLDDAQEISTDQLVTDVSIVQGSVAYRFDGEAGQTLFLDVRDSENMTNASWRLLSPSGQSVFSNSFRDVQDITLSEGGTHTLIVEGYRFETEPGQYSFFIETLPQEAPRPLPFTTPIFWINRYSRAGSYL